MARSPKRSLTKAERDILWSEVRYEVEGVEWPVRLAKGPEGVADALSTIRTAVRLVEDVAALYGDIGWEEEDDDRASFELTLPEDRLRVLGGLLRTTATELLADELEGPFASRVPSRIDQYRDLLRLACGLEGTDPAGLLERFTAKAVS